MWIIHPYIQCRMGANQLMYFKDRDAGERGGTLYWAQKQTRKDCLRETQEASDYVSHSSLTFLVESPLMVWHCLYRPELSTSNFTSQDRQQASVSSLPNMRWSQSPSLHPTWETSLWKTEAVLRKGRYLLCWHWGIPLSDREQFYSNCFV